ncbi:hypothetical protein H0E84_19300 [Luteimonas sp. SJ-92]|uniref:Two component regulator three Y domain-containing protein n=1 Tax=Luteimonas salinisoli TaxID=2752307 RepID=A0A853JIG2_9GAMM|nr:two-component regulator propeller domain-containing protein [Luteimonas salinisoli]NZA28524.1 hypothetical protein [Luteimonas salinisoli]
MGLDILLIGLALLGDPAPPAATELQYRIVPRYYTADDGLPQSGVNAIVQSADGYLWIGTFGGLVRFDGSRFETFRADTGLRGAEAPEGDRAGPGSDRILALHEDDAGRLWIGTQDAGLSVFEDGTFRQLPACGDTCQIGAIVQDRRGTIWLASNEGIFSVDPADGRAGQVPGSARSGHHHIAIDPVGRIFVGGYGGLHLLEADRLRAIPLPDGHGRVHLLKSEAGTLLIGTERALYRFDPENGRWLSLGVELPAYATRDGDGRWWVATRAAQVMREDAGGAWHAVPELDGLGISSMSVDDEGNLWIGGASRGLLRLRTPLFGLFAEAQLGTPKAGRAVVGDGGAGLWFGLSCDGLRHWREDGSIVVVEFQEAMENDCVASLLLDREGTAWVGNAGGRLGRLVDGSVEHVAAFAPHASVGVWQETDGSYLVGSGRSTYRLVLDAAGREAGRHRIEALEGMSINQVVASARGGRWFIGDRGVLRLVGDRVVEQWTPAEGLSSRFARALHEDVGAGVLWVGTYGGGLNRIAGGQVRHYGQDNGLFDDTVSCILSDDSGRLWLGGNRGVTLLPSPRQAGDEIASVGYAASDGLVPAEINGGVAAACHRDTRGRLWFALVEGFAAVDPAAVGPVEPPSLRPHIEHVAVAGRPRKSDGSTLVLDPFARNLEIRYTAINLSQPLNTRFRFRLSGFDEDWVEAGSNRSILYPSVPWGEHLFEVQASVLGGPWSPAAATLRIRHPQPWYQRPWIWMLATALGLVVLVGSTRAEREDPEPSPSRLRARGRGPR